MPEVLSFKVPFNYSPKPKHPHGALTTCPTGEAWEVIIYQGWVSLNHHDVGRYAWIDRCYGRAHKSEVYAHDFMFGNYWEARAYFLKIADRQNKP